jgi:hypothetical protein
VRRLLAGELPDAERARLEEHLGGCARCQVTRRELEEERRAVEAALPFPAFASGVAERLAAPGRDRRAKPPALLRRFAPLALAASLALGVAVPLVLRLSQHGDPEGTRLKGGGAAITVFVADAAGARALASGEAVPENARLRVSLAPAGRRQMAVALLDPDGPTLLYAGPAAAGPLPEAFEWTGAPQGTIVAVLADAPLDAGALLARLSRGGAGAAAPQGQAVEVVTFSLTRRSPP